ncbi:MAG: hypothetical protein ABIX37_09890 [Gammaproteobacteria bacterium]
MAGLYGGASGEFPIEAPTSDDRHGIRDLYRAAAATPGGLARTAASS